MTVPIRLHPSSEWTRGPQANMADATTQATSMASAENAALGNQLSQPAPSGPNIEMELAKLANDAMQAGHDPHQVTGQLHAMIAHLRKNPQVAQQATNALADGVSSIQDISRTLGQQMQTASAAPPVATESTSAQPKPAAHPSDPTEPGIGMKVLGTLASLGTKNPGIEAVQAETRALTHGYPYSEGLKEVRALKQMAPPWARHAAEIVGALPLAMMLPGGPAGSGALIGGADEALNADPNESLTKRAVMTGVGAGAGALAGKAIGTLTGAAASAFSGNPATTRFAMLAKRAASGKALYDAAHAEGRANEITPQIQDFLNDEDIAPIVAKIRGGRTGATLDTPQLLDRVYKELSDIERTAARPLASADPTKPNTAVSRLMDVKAAKQKMLNLMSSPGKKPPLTLDVAPETFETEPNIVPGHESMTGPIVKQPLGSYSASQPRVDAEPSDFHAGQAPRTEVPRARTASGGLRAFAKVNDDELANEYRLLVDENAKENVAPTVTGALPTDFSDLHVGMKQGAVHAAGRVAARVKSIAKVEAELKARGINASDAYASSAERAAAATEGSSDATSFDFGENVREPMQGPGGPAFRMKAQPDKITPGVRIETPGMRVQTAPAEDLPPMMPSYPKAVSDYAQRSEQIRAFDRGYEAYMANLSGKMPTVARNLTRKTPVAFAEWAKTATPEELATARQGIRQAANAQMQGSANPFKGFGVPSSIGRMGKAAPLLRSTLPTPSPTAPVSALADPHMYLSTMQNLGLLTAGNQMP